MVKNRVYRVPTLLYFTKRVLKLSWTSECAQVVRSGDQAIVNWSQVFNDGPECTEVDFLIMNHPRKQLSAYKLSDFTLKGERSATLTIDPTLDFVFQVIAREDKGDLGIDYKYR